MRAARRLDAEQEAVIAVDVEGIISFGGNRDRGVRRGHHVVVAPRHPAVRGGRQRIPREGKVAHHHPATVPVRLRIAEVEEGFLGVNHRVRGEGRRAVDIRARQEVQGRSQVLRPIQALIEVGAHAPSAARAQRPRQHHRPSPTRHQGQHRCAQSGLIDQVSPVGVLADHVERVALIGQPSDRLHQRGHPANLARPERPHRRKRRGNVIPVRHPASALLGEGPVAAREVLVQHRGRSRLQRHPSDFPVNPRGRIPFIPRSQEANLHRVPRSSSRDAGNGSNQRAIAKTSRRPIETKRAVQHSRPDDRSTFIVAILAKGSAVQRGEFPPIHAHLNDPAIVGVSRREVPFKIVAVLHRQLNRIAIRNRQQRRSDRPVLRSVPPSHLPAGPDAFHADAEGGRIGHAARAVVFHRECHFRGGIDPRPRQIRRRPERGQLRIILRQNLRIAQQNIVHPHLGNAQPRVKAARIPAAVVLRPQHDRKAVVGVEVAVELRIRHHPIDIHPRSPRAAHAAAIIRVHQVVPHPRRRSRNAAPPDIRTATPLAQRPVGRVAPKIARVIRAVPTPAVTPGHQGLFIRNARVVRPNFHRTRRVHPRNARRRHRTHIIISPARERHRLDARHRLHGWGPRGHKGIPQSARVGPGAQRT